MKSTPFDGSQSTPETKPALTFPVDDLVQDFLDEPTRESLKSTAIKANLGARAALKILSHLNDVAANPDLIRQNLGEEGVLGAIVSDELQALANQPNFKLKALVILAKGADSILGAADTAIIGQNEFLTTREARRNVKPNEIYEIVNEIDREAQKEIGKRREAIAAERESFSNDDPLIMKRQMDSFRQQEQEIDTLAARMSAAREHHKEAAYGYLKSLIEIKPTHEELNDPAKLEIKRQKMADALQTTIKLKERMEAVESGAILLADLKETVPEKTQPPISMPPPAVEAAAEPATSPPPEAPIVTASSNMAAALEAAKLGAGLSWAAASGVVQKNQEPVVEVGQMAAPPARDASATGADIQARR